MNKVVISIPTYKRPEMLKKLILSILNCRIDKSIIADITIIVVDNDIENSAEDIIENQLILKNKINNLIYHSYSEKGLSNVRNEMLRKAYELQSDFIVFIDDDEYVSTEWLNELVKTIINNNADLVRGPVFTDFAVETPDKISCWFSREDYPDNYKLDKLSSGNLIMKRTSLLKFGIWFDIRFNKSGSEDSYFGKQLLKKGAKICWATKAITYETIPAERTTLNWLIKRNYREAGTFSYILKVEKEHFPIFKKAIISFMYVFIGVLSSVLAIFPFKKRYWGILKLSEGLGGLAGFGNKMYSEYK